MCIKTLITTELHNQQTIFPVLISKLSQHFTLQSFTMPVTTKQHSRQLIVRELITHTFSVSTLYVPDHTYNPPLPERVLLGYNPKCSGNFS